MREQGEVQPPMGGCWFCWHDDGEMYFTVEWDAFFHRDCLVEIIDETRDADWKDEEAEIMAREFGLIDADGKRIYTGALDADQRTTQGGVQPPDAPGQRAD